MHSLLPIASPTQEQLSETDTKTLLPLLEIGGVEEVQRHILNSLLLLRVLCHGVMSRWGWTKP